MAITLKKSRFWLKAVDDKPAALSDTLALLAQARTDLQAVMGYRYPGDQGKAAIELHPVSGKKAIEAAIDRPLRRRFCLAPGVAEGNNGSTCTPYMGMTAHGGNNRERS